MKNAMKIVLMGVVALLCASEAMAESFTDSRDGKTYKTVKIGRQTWMAENLNYEMEDSYCNPENYCGDGYGRLYTWKAAMKACPSGWHLPSKTDLEKLLAVAMGDANGNKEIAAKHLRSRYEWTNKVGDDKFGFDALPAGYYQSEGQRVFGGFGERADFWSSTESDEYNAYGLYVDDKNASVDWLINFQYGSKQYGGSVRCLKYTEAEIAKQRAEEERKRIAMGSFKDPRDGKKYRTVKMPDGKTWMAENLNYKMEDSYCNPKNNCGDGYGRLYTWKAAQKACPSGWRLPTKTDIEKMLDVVGRDDQERGLHLRTNHDWNGNGDDAYFFSVLPAGFYLGDSKEFNNLGTLAYLWSSTEYGSSSRGAFSLGVDGIGASVVNIYKTGGFSVRCLQGSN